MVNKDFSEQDCKIYAVVADDLHCVTVRAKDEIQAQNKAVAYLFGHGYVARKLKAILVDNEETI